MNIREYLLNQIPAHPHDVVRKTMDQFQVTRAAVLFHLNKLKGEGLVQQTGSRNKVTYQLSNKSTTSSTAKNFHYEVGKEGEYEIWKNDVAPFIGKVPRNVADILQYGFTEIFNNVIDHSESSKASVEIQKKNVKILIDIKDFGVGAFKKIADHLQEKDLREAIIQLHAGKVTTDSKRHTGQGIFFTSKAVDQFTLTANGYLYHRDNTQTDDWYFVSTGNKEKGTYVTLVLAENSTRELKDVFDRYTDPEDFSFDTTHLRIELSKYEEDSFVSRSQAKRILAGVKKFRTIILDFKHLRFVGQAFVDEVFGVFGIEHPTIHFQIQNANDDIKFMIRRSLADRNLSVDRVKGIS